MKKIYIFPLSNNNPKFNNKYTLYLSKSLSSHYIISNSSQVRNWGIFDIIKFLESDIFVFNWTEKLNFLKYGLAQTFVYMISVLYLKVRGKKIIWILHNKEPHEGMSLIAKFLIEFNSKKANYVITHSYEGVNYALNVLNIRKDIVNYIPHPIYPESKLVETEKIYDIIIWGNIERYKNILEFLIYWKSFKGSEKYKIIVCGKCKDEKYLDSIRSLRIENVEILNEYLSDEELNLLISKSKAILFTYNGQSVLSSGALIYSLPFNSTIIGPNIGSFRDMKNEGLIETYTKFEEIPDLLDSYSQESLQKRVDFIKLNTWSKFAMNFQGVINS